MKPREKVQLPLVTGDQIEQSMRKSETVQIRVTPKEKAEIVKAKDFLGLTTTEYLVRCHQLISEKLKGL